VYLHEEAGPRTTLEVRKIYSLLGISVEEMQCSRNVGEIWGFTGDKYDDVFRDVPPCTVEENDRRFIGYYCLHIQGDDGGIKNL
jgi:hypothetical protein